MTSAIAAAAAMGLPEDEAPDYEMASDVAPSSYVAAGLVDDTRSLPTVFTTDPVSGIRETPKGPAMSAAAPSVLSEAVPIGRPLVRGPDVPA